MRVQEGSQFVVIAVAFVAALVAILTLAPDYVLVFAVVAVAVAIVLAIRAL